MTLLHTEEDLHWTKHGLCGRQGDSHSGSDSETGSSVRTLVCGVLSVVIILISTGQSRRSYVTSLPTIQSSSPCETSVLDQLAQSIDWTFISPPLAAATFRFLSTFAASKSRTPLGAHTWIAARNGTKHRYKHGT